MAALLLVIHPMRVDEIARVSNPSNFIRQQLQYFADAKLDRVQFLVRFDYRAQHLPDQSLTELMAIYEVVKQPVTRISFLVSDQREKILQLFEQRVPPQNIAAQLNIAWVQLNRGLLLAPVHIAKPWGQEIWFTGIEARGVASVKTEQGLSPLDWVIAAAPEHVMGEGYLEKPSAPLLLKILDPLPDEVYGDLYFEMHEQKQEVYVVTDIDETAWPDRQGGIRFGFDQQIRGGYADDKAFKQAYLDAVNNYRSVREQIDTVLDTKRGEENIALDTPVTPETVQQWLQSVDTELLAQEQRLRCEMESFIAIKPLQVGDVVKVPCLTPHSLQHGVRTVEFQTPVYERKILSFAQKVLTQDHWDTAEALEKMSLDAPLEQPLQVLSENERLLREQVVNFDDFSVERITLRRGAKLNLSQQCYCLLLLLEGEITLDGMSYGKGEGVFLPAATVPVVQTKEIALLLLAQPVLNDVQKLH